MTCSGDSGSPLVTFDSTTRQYTQVGVVSGGTCASYSDPGIFARLEHHAILKFIQDNIWTNMPLSNVKIIEKLLLKNEDLENELKDLKTKLNNLEEDNLQTRITNLEDENIQLKKKDSHLEKVIALLGKNVRKCKMLETRT